MCEAARAQQRAARLAEDGHVLTVCRQQTSTEAAPSCPALEPGGTAPSPSPPARDIGYLVRTELPVLPLLTDPRDRQEVTDGIQLQHPRKGHILHPGQRQLT